MNSLDSHSQHYSYCVLLLDRRTCRWRDIYQAFALKATFSFEMSIILALGLQ